MLMLAGLFVLMGTAQAQQGPRLSDPLYLFAEGLCGPNQDDAGICVQGTLAWEDEMLACLEDYCANNCCGEETPPCEYHTCQEPDAMLQCPPEATIHIQVDANGDCNVQVLSERRVRPTGWIVRVRMKCRDGCVKSGRGYGDTYCQAFCDAYKAARTWCSIHGGATGCYCVEIIQRPCCRPCCR
ncbi:MAG: hypothetical protein D6753_18245 [Planctomycetota bacterium]|nr:MAG: hypothetical protein D6753_18245 [Planctomycetota bacterium]